MKNNNTRVIIAVLVLLLVAAGAYFALRDRGEDVSADRQPAPSTQTAAPQTEPPSPDMQEEVSRKEPKDEAATAEPDAGVTEDTEEQTVEQQQATLRIPTFDLLRVEPDGTAVIAGGAEPLGVLDVKEEENVLASSDVTESGDFVAIVETPLSPGDHLLYLSVTMPDGRTVRSEQTATVSIPDGNNGELLALITEPGKASEIISAPELQTTTTPENTVVATRETDGNDQKAGAPDNGQDRDMLTGETSGDRDTETNLPAVNVETRGGDRDTAEAVTAAQEPLSDQKPVAVTVSIKAVEIEDDTLFVAGEGEIGATIRGYVDDALVAEGSVNVEGNYVLEAKTDVSVGLHTIRVDMLDADNRVVARAVVPFDRPPGNQIAAISTNADGTSAEQTDGTRTFVQPQLQGSDNAVIIRRGDNLWRISRRVYGRGVRYTTIYLANETQIVNPDLILPGQVFSVPVEPLPDSEAETIHRRLLEGMPVGPEYQLPPADQ
ncbi:LysM peptidoglycan-binding domain-containing protein [Martelella lutilitoris]|uniref:LysM peptidoglycan-binding domain-containing protein n=1 Tax=Martelella lutilitoris TaxID=2583532 RepID=A0A7T7HGP9_9HYPH|nr:LysM peptidoglycan-binding domain-containing protein [Martelella lutilitoris]QQM28827.1 LysM peptidoglycan-binding domain-containing protein [Martelella lutilitoris]